MYVKQLKTLKDIDKYIKEHDLKISQWNKLINYLVKHKIKGININYLVSSLPKHWSETLKYVINYIVLLDKGITLSNED